jgi:hypothetical protein
MDLDVARFSLSKENDANDGPIDSSAVVSPSKARAATTKGPRVFYPSRAAVARLRAAARRIDNPHPPH